MLAGCWHRAGCADGAGLAGVNGVALPPSLYEAPAALGSVCCWLLEETGAEETNQHPAQAQVSTSSPSTGTQLGHMGPGAGLGAGRHCSPGGGDRIMYWGQHPWKHCRALETHGDVGVCPSGAQDLKKSQCPSLPSVKWGWMHC